MPRTFQRYRRQRDLYTIYTCALDTKLLTKHETLTWCLRAHDCTGRGTLRHSHPKKIRCQVITALAVEVHVYKIAPLCRLLSISRWGYYKHDEKEDEEAALNTFFSRAEMSLNDIHWPLSLLPQPPRSRPSCSPPAAPVRCRPAWCASCSCSPSAMWNRPWGCPSYRGWAVRPLRHTSGAPPPTDRHSAVDETVPCRPGLG